MQWIRGSFGHRCLRTVSVLAIVCGTASPSRLPDEGSVSGTVLVHGEPAAGARVRVAGTTIASVVTGEDGSYRLPSVPTLGVVLEVHRSSSRGFSRIGQVRLPDRPGNRVQDFDLQPIPVAISLQWDDGLVGWGLRVEAKPCAEPYGEQPTISWTSTDAKGNATLELPGPGRYRVVAQSYGDGRGAAAFDVKAGDTPTWTIPLVPYVDCSGTVKVHGRGGAGWRSLYFESLDKGVTDVPEVPLHCDIRSGSDAFEMWNTTPGRYIARLKSGGEILESEPFELPEGGLRDLVIKFGEDG